MRQKNTGANGQKNLKKTAGWKRERVSSRSVPIMPNPSPIINVCGQCRHAIPKNSYEWEGAMGFPVTHYYCRFEKCRGVEPRLHSRKAMA